MNETTSFTKGKEQTLNWRTVGVKRERKHEQLIERLTLNNKTIFVYHKDLMVFAAMVGRSLGVRKPLEGDVIRRMGLYIFWRC